MNVEAIKAFLLPLLQALLSGALAGLMGYMKQEDLKESWKAIFTKKFWETFDPVKALKTIIISMFVYLIAYLFSATPQTLEEIGIMTLIIYGVDGLVKFIVRRTPIVRAWNYLKAKVLPIFS